MIGTRLKEVCGKDKKFKTLKELAECVGVSSNMLYLTLRSKKSLSLKTLQSLVHNTGVSSNYLLGEFLKTMRSKVSSAIHAWKRNLPILVTPIKKYKVQISNSQIGNNKCL